MTSLLQFPDLPLPPWARHGRYGEGGSFGFQIDASGAELRNYMMSREWIPATADVTLQVRMRVKGILVVGNPAFEGGAVRMQGRQLEGSAPSDSDRQVWDSNPLAGGTSSWISGDFPEFTTVNFMVNIPAGLGIDYVSVEFVVRAISGQIEIDNFECRHYYGKLYEINIIGFQGWTSSDAFNIEVFDNAISGTNNAVRRFVRYLFTEDVLIRKGQSIITNVKTLMAGRSFEWLNAELTNSQRIPGVTGVTLKYRRKGTGTYDYMDAGGGYSSVESKTFVVNETRQRRAPYDYDQVELIVYNEPEPTSANFGYSADRLSYQDIELDLIVADFVAPSQ